ncbi:unnamed protein product [Brachionus calyciflorus]|uniref:HAT C-terminal dimerisation domain-containing protein n=1 Tax=Brachionus calyciflorus TaxID=104777 RepID=A0A814LWC5_9BILA|nr:unnamed protein product [Brachionus calyciflorus]
MLASEENEIDKFFSCQNIGFQIDPIEWWNTNAKDFPNLSKIALEFMAAVPTSVSMRLRKDNQLYVEFLDVYYDSQKIRGYNVYYFNGTNLIIEEKNNLRIGEIRIDFKKKTLKKINIRANSTLVNQLQFCWISQLNFSSSCSSAVGGTGGTIYTFYYDTEFKQFQIEYLIVFNVWHNDNVQFIFNQLNF